LELKSEFISGVDLITDNIFIGDYDDASDLITLKDLNITNVLICAAKLEMKFPNNFTYKHLVLEDNEEENIAQYFEHNYIFIKKAIEKKGKVFVVCFFGVSRSVTCVIAFLMKYKNLSIENSFNLVKSKRYLANPNDGFIIQLKQYEISLESNKSLNITTKDEFEKDNNELKNMVDFKIIKIKDKTIPISIKPTILIINTNFKTTKIKTGN